MITPLMPREKLLVLGAKALTDEELLAIFLRTGIKNCPVMQLATNVLAEFGSLRELIRADKKTFCQIKGLGVTQFIQLQATTEMTKRYLAQEIKNQHVFNEAKVARLYLQTELSHQEREIFFVLFLDNQHCLIKSEEMFLGTVNSAMVYPREIIKSALYCNACALILAHNHPSGEVTPSEADRNITKDIQNAAKLMDIRVLDHFIIGKGNYFSFAENGYI